MWTGDLGWRVSSLRWILLAKSAKRIFFWWSTGRVRAHFPVGPYGQLRYIEQQKRASLNSMTIINNTTANTTPHHTTPRHSTLKFVGAVTIVRHTHILWHNYQVANRNEEGVNLQHISKECEDEFCHGPSYRLSAPTKMAASNKARAPFPNLRLCMKELINLQNNDSNKYIYRTESKGDKRREMRTYIFSTTPWNDSISYSRAQYKMTVREYLHNAWVSCLNKQPKSRLTTTNPASIDCGFVIISPTHGTHALEIAERTRRIQPIPQPPKLWTQIRSKCN